MKIRLEEEKDLSEEQKPLVTISDSLAKDLTVSLLRTMNELYETNDMVRQHDLSILVNSVAKFTAYISVITEEKFGIPRDKATAIFADVSKAYSELTEVMQINTNSFH